MHRSELTPTERLKVFVKYLSSFACAAIGGFRIARFISGPGVTIVAYHRIIKDDHVGVRPYISVTQRALRRQIRFFKKHYSLTSLQDAVERIKENRVDRHYLVITFDDGYRDNHELGLDIFLSEGVRPAIFITTDCVEKRQELWPDTIRHALYGARFSAPTALPAPEIIIEQSLSSRIRATKAIIAHVKNMDSEQRSIYLDGLQRRLRSPPTGDRLM
jgi:peptidoglycan/xylan/chitin deacetylase (PgdA/CDA1 family)